MITWWPGSKYRSPYSIDHWYLENGRVYIVMSSGCIELLKGHDPLHMQVAVLSGTILEKDLPPECAKSVSNNRRKP